jgi:hypothetical protein
LALSLGRLEYLLAGGKAPQREGFQRRALTMSALYDDGAPWMRVPAGMPQRVRDMSVPGVFAPAGARHAGPAARLLTIGRSSPDSGVPVPGGPARGPVHSFSHGDQTTSRQQTAAPHQGELRLESSTESIPRVVRRSESFSGNRRCACAATPAENIARAPVRRLVRFLRGPPDACTVCACRSFQPARG